MTVPTRRSYLPLVLLTAALLLALPAAASAVGHSDGAAGTEHPLGINLERLQERARDLADQGLQALERHSDTLEGAAERAEGLVRDLGDKGAASWERVESGLQGAWERLQQALAPASDAEPEGDGPGTPGPGQKLI